MFIEKYFMSVFIKNKNQIDCNNNGEASGKTNDCSCNCFDGFSWDGTGFKNSNCRKLLECTTGKNNKKCIGCDKFSIVIL